MILEPVGVELVGGYVGFQAVGGFYKAVVRAFIAQCIDEQVADRVEG